MLTRRTQASIAPLLGAGAQIVLDEIGTSVSGARVRVVVLALDGRMIELLEIME